MNDFTNTVTQDTTVATLTLSEHVSQTVKNYIKTIGGKKVDLDLYQLIMEEVEAPLFRTVMELTRYNQSKAARVLGVSRGTLRTKLKYYFEDEFIGTR
jgi:Fis family transcriptional regulator